MAWEQRGNRNYFYRKKRTGGKVQSDYVGSGDAAGLIERYEQIEKQRAEAAAEELAEARAKAEAIDEQINELSEINQTLVDALFLLNGFYRHKGQWRKKRK